MATSGDTTYTIDRDGVINAALKLCGVLGEGGTGNSSQLSDNAELLNMIVKSWSGQGLHLWAKDEIILFPVKNQKQYGLGGSSADRACLTSEFIETELDGDHSASATSLTVDSTTGMAGSDVIGVQTDSGGIHWTTISSVDSSTTLTIASGLSAAASDNKNVYTYTTVYQVRPTRIQYAQRKRDDDEFIPVKLYSHEEYNSLSDKDSSGPILHVYYDPQLTEGQLYVWQVPDDNYTDEVLYLTVSRPIEDFDAATDDVEMPQEWYLALVYNLALSSGVMYGISDSRYNRIATWATKYLEDVLHWDSEKESIYIEPSYDRRR